MAGVTGTTGSSAVSGAAARAASAALTKDAQGTYATTGTNGTRYALSSSGRVSEDKTNLKNQDFLQLLIKQLQHQDPSSPMDSNAIMQQTATLSSTQTMQQMITVQQEQFSLMSRMSASGFVGQTVDYTDASGKTQTGLVSAAAFKGTGTPTLTIGNASVSLSDVSGITAPSASKSS